MGHFRMITFRVEKRIVLLKSDFGGEFEAGYTLLYVRRSLTSYLSRTSRYC